LVQVFEEVALFGGGVGVAAVVDFAFADERRHFAESTHRIENFTEGVGGVVAGFEKQWRVMSDEWREKEGEKAEKRITQRRRVNRGAQRGRREKRGEKRIPRYARDDMRGARDDMRGARDDMRGGGAARKET
jgi:hypothetical protein